MQTLNDKTLSTKTIAIIMLIVIATMLVVSMCMMVQPVLAENAQKDGGEVSTIGRQVGEGIDAITKTIKDIVNPIATVAVVCCAIFLLVGSDPASLRKVKTWMISIIGGLLLVNLADNLVKWASNIAK